MAVKKRREAAPEGPVSIRLLGSARARALAEGLARALDVPLALDEERLEGALAHVYDASALSSGPGDCRAQAALLMIGMRDERPGGPLDEPLAWLLTLALLDLNGHALEDVPYADVAACLTSLGAWRAVDGSESGEAEALYRWLLARSRPATSALPLPLAEVIRLLEGRGLKVESTEGGHRVLREVPPDASKAWPLRLLARASWEPLHAFADPADGVLGSGALRELRKACGLEEGPFLDDRAWQEGVLRHHRHLWPRLREAWPD